MKINFLGNVLENLNLSKTKNGNKLIDIITKESLSYALALNPQEWHPELYSEFKHIDDFEDTQIRDGTFPCGRCAHNKVYSLNTSHFDKQTRSGDEASTIFVTCHTCGNKWRICN